MSRFARVCAAALLSVAGTAVSALAADRDVPRHHRHHHTRHHGAAGDIYSHNYGPPVRPDRAFAFYDGPLSAGCKQSAAAYRGQDGKRHPCN
jgi:hypothetical protein